MIYFYETNSLIDYLTKNCKDKHIRFPISIRETNGCIELQTILFEEQAETIFPLNIPVYHDIFFRENNKFVSKEKSHLEIMKEDGIFRC